MVIHVYVKEFHAKDGMKNWSKGEGKGKAKKSTDDVTRTCTSFFWYEWQIHHQFVPLHSFEYK